MPLIGTEVVKGVSRPLCTRRQAPIEKSEKGFGRRDRKIRRRCYIAMLLYGITPKMPRATPGIVLLIESRPPFRARGTPTHEKSYSPRARARARVKQPTKSSRSR